MAASSSQRAALPQLRLDAGQKPHRWLDEKVLRPETTLDRAMEELLLALEPEDASAPDDINPHFLSHLQQKTAAEESRIMEKMGWTGQRRVRVTLSVFEHNLRQQEQQKRLTPTYALTKLTRRSSDHFNLAAVETLSSKARLQRAASVPAISTMSRRRVPSSADDVVESSVPTAAAVLPSITRISGIVYDGPLGMPDARQLAPRPQRRNTAELRLEVRSNLEDQEFEQRRAAAQKAAAPPALSIDLLSSGGIEFKGRAKGSSTSEPPEPAAIAFPIRSRYLSSEEESEALHNFRNQLIMRRFELQSQAGTAVAAGS